MPAWLPWAAAAAAGAAFLLVLVDAGLWHPGYAYGDERFEISWLQNLREGAPMTWVFGGGCLTRAAQWAWVALNGPSLAALHTPELAVLAAEWLCLVLVARRWFGEEAAAWSLLAAALSAQTWTRARSLLAFQALPMETLLLALASGRVDSRARALAWGGLAGLVFLDYDGALIAVPGIWVACVAMDRGFRRQALYSALGLCAVGGAVLVLGHGSLAAYAASRLGRGLDAATDAGLRGRLIFLKDLAVGGPVLPYLGVGRWPAWPWWTWAALVAAAWGLRRSPGTVLVVWAAGAAVLTQMIHSSYGPPVHRLAAVFVPLALLSGVGMARIRRVLGARAWMLGLLLVLGAATEGWAWWRHQMTFAPELYDRCSTLEEVRLGYRGPLEDPSVRVLTQLSGFSQADARFVLDRPLRKTGDGGPLLASQGRVLAIVPADYATALEGGGAGAAWIWAAKGLEPLVVVEAQGAQAFRLTAIEDALTGLVGTQAGSAAGRRERATAWLRSNPGADGWLRTAALEADLEAAVQAGPLSVEEFSWLRTPGLLSSAPWMVLARSTYLSDPRSAIYYCRRAEALDPRNGEALLVEAAGLRALGAPRAGQVSDAWVQARESGLAWRHTQ